MYIIVYFCIILHILKYILIHINFHFSLLEKGRQILMKDNLIDEERAKQEEAAQESLEQKLERLGESHINKIFYVSGQLLLIYCIQVCLYFQSDV